MTFILLDNTREEEGGAWLFENPYEIISAFETHEVDEALRKLEHVTQQGAFAAGFFSYELGYALEPRLNALMPDKRSVPLLWFGVFKERKRLTQAEATVFLQASLRGGEADEAIQLKMGWNEEQYAQRFQKVKSYIINGDIYQLNLTFKTCFDYSGDPVALYLKLREQQPVSYGAYIDTPEFKVLSLSPELFIHQQQNHIETRPMKGTAPRAYLPQDDKKIAEELAKDPKSQAENLMIVDLMRNDLGRIAETGSMKVSNLFHVDTYKTLHQMISTVSAKVKAEIKLPEILKALFAPGSVTGTPKIRAQEIIRELESEPRGVYTGAIGMLGPRNEKHLNVAIRTVMLFPEKDDLYKGEMGVGSGVVYDSGAEKEYAECILKTRFFTEYTAVFSLFETLRYDADGGYYLLERHIERLRNSAHYFGFQFNENEIRSELNNHVKGSKEPHLRARLELARDRNIKIESMVLPKEVLSQTLRFVICDMPIHSQNVYLYHKTTVRDFLDVPCKAFKEKTGCDEVIFLNESGEVTQGSYTNVFVDRGDGVLLTPPVSVGLLPGTLRAGLLHAGKAIEKTLCVDDLNKAKAVYLGNSVRGLLLAEMIDLKNNSIENQ